MEDVQVGDPTMLAKVGLTRYDQGVEVSWVHHPKKGIKALHHTKSPAPTAQVSRKPATPSKDLPPRPPSPQSDAVSARSARRQGAIFANAPPEPYSSPDSSPAVKITPPSSGPSNNSAPPPNLTSTPSGNTIRPPVAKRPSLLRGSSGEKPSPDHKSGSKRSTSWISNISNKFSSPAAPPGTDRTPAPSAQIPLPSPSGYSNGSGGSPAVTPGTEASEEAEPNPPPKSKESSSGFFSSLTRKLSSAQNNTGPKVQGKGGLCERRILNVDPNRDRCLVPDMDPSVLRKVSFCVDVEIAGGPRYIDDDEPEMDEEAVNKRKKDAKLKERAEGEALKQGKAMSDDNDNEAPRPNGQSRDARSGSISTHEDDAHSVDTDGHDSGVSDKKKEKKKRSEEERKERKEKRRRRAEENGSVPVELSLDGDGNAPDAFISPPSSLPDRPNPPHAPDAQPNSPRRAAPTTDPVRIYRRCCQLRETPILKRITEQLMSPTCCVPAEPGVVHVLNLRGSRLQLADMVTLGDWLAVVPVKKLYLEDADLSDEGLRCILAGLLAATKPQPTKRKSPTPRHRQGIQAARYRERSGVIEKLTLNKNPRLTRNAWKHICLFLYMCRSIKEIDLSQVKFPETVPGSTRSIPIQNIPNAPKGNGLDIDAAEMLFRCLSERLGGKRLEELSFAGCGLSTQQIRKIVDGAVTSGLNRLGLAGNKIDDDGLEHVMRYLGSGICGGLDLGTTNLKGKLDRLAGAIDRKAEVPLWSLGLANCNLDSESLKPLFSVLGKLPDLRIVDLSHNPKLCGRDNGTITLLRHYLSQMKMLKRLVLSDVDMSPKQAIALADVLPECPSLAHLGITQNPKLIALANATNEADQEEACALYASLMAAARVSATMVSIDIEAPSAENSEVVKALAKQVIAYCLRNVEQYALAEETGAPLVAASDAGNKDNVKEVAVPDILMHLVGHMDGNHENHDNDDPAPDDDYIVGGTGVVKALQYVLGEKGSDLHRNSSPIPALQRPGSSAGFDPEQRGKAKKMSKNLLESARKIRLRLRPALVKEVTAGNDAMAYRRLIFLDQTLESMINRFEEEYPECRPSSPSPKQPASVASSLTDRSAPFSINTAGTDFTKVSDDEDDFEEDGTLHPALSRHNSNVSTASRALGIEEGHLHRLGMRLRREVVDSPPSGSPVRNGRADENAWKEDDAKRLEALSEQLEAMSGRELKSLVEQGGYNDALRKIGGNLEDLRHIQQNDPAAWKQFEEAQLKARLNAEGP